jgi:ribosomal protein L11 methyltransferase
MPGIPDTWLEISVEVAGIDAETAADLFRQACPGGAVIEPGHRLDREVDAYVVDGDAPAVVRGYLPTDTDAHVQTSLRLALQAAPLVSPPKWRRSRRVREESWRDAWKKHFGVQRIGRALVVRPSWVDYGLEGNETVIHLDPGMAFGTGQHPTTAMCLRALEERVRPGVSVLDLGCGSGILAIAAAKLGAARVLALDTDPQAIKAATENAAANGVSDVIEVREGTVSLTQSASGRHPFDSAQDRPSPVRGRVENEERFDLIAANISGLTLTRLAPALAAALNPGGALIASGFLEDAVADLRRAFEEAGLFIEQTIEDGVWRALVADKA